MPRPGEFGHDTWEGDSWKDRGGANAWARTDRRPRAALVFAGPGSAAFDFYGGDRKGDNLFANSTLALDARTGARRLALSDAASRLWDHDLPTPPCSSTVTHDGRAIDAAAQVTKTGFVFLFDRATGGRSSTSTIGRVRLRRARRAPAADAAGPGEAAAVLRQSLPSADVSEHSPEAKAKALARFRRLRGGPLFTPPSLQGTVAAPRHHGGANWSGASFDPTTGVLYVNANKPWIVPARQHAPGTACPSSPPISAISRSRRLPRHHAAVGHAVRHRSQRRSHPLAVPLGEHPELAARGLRNTGTENFGGPIVTAGGLVFIGGAKDERSTPSTSAPARSLGARLSAGGYATPATYAVDGRQFSSSRRAAAASSHPSGDAFVAFAFPGPTASSR